MMGDVINWININSGLIEVLIFIITILIAWVSGFFRFLNNKPKFIIDIINGPTFCTEIDKDNMRENYQMKRIAAALYLNIANIGRKNTSISDIRIKYRSNYLKFERLSLWNRVSKYEQKLENIKFLYCWSNELRQTVIKSPFQVKIDNENYKKFPLLFQNNFDISHIDTYLEVGKSTNGIIYFESENECGGGYRPKVLGKEIEIEISVIDVFGKSHNYRKNIPIVTVEEAREYNISFGNSFNDFYGNETLGEQ